MYPIVSIIDDQSITNGDPKELHIYVDGSLKGNMTGFTVVNYAPILKRRFQSFIDSVLEDYMPEAKGSVGSLGGSQGTEENFESTSDQNGADSGGK